MTMRARRGSALILVLLMTLAIAGLSIAAIFMSSSANLLSMFYDREREYALVADAGIAMVRARLERDLTLAVPDTGMRQVLSGTQVLDAGGSAIARVRVNAYVAMTGDTTGLSLPTVTIIAAVYDAGGTRHVRRLDLRRESFSRYAYFADSVPSGQAHGPATVNGRVHANGNWRMTSSGNRYRDTVTTGGSVTGTGTFDVPNVSGVSRVPYPVDSTYPRLDTLAGAANLSFAPVSGGTRGSRLEFVAYDVDGDGTVEPTEGFARIFDLANTLAGDTTRLRVSPLMYASDFFGIPLNRWDDPIVQNQCGAFYLRGGRWHFFPVSVHRRPYAATIIQSTASGSYPGVSSSLMDDMNDYDVGAVDEIMSQPTARCFPAGSPYLMPAERMSDPSGAITGTPADTVPFGVVAPSGGWPVSAPTGYGGSDTTFSVRSRSCQVATGTGRCVAGTLYDLGTWRAFGGTAISSAPDSVMQAVERPYLWPLQAPLNPASRGVISATAGPLHVSGIVAGPVTLRVNGRVVVVDRLRYVRDPNGPDVAACTDRLGLVATGDILVVNGLTSRARRIRSTTLGSATAEGHFGGTTRFVMQGHFLSTTGTVSVEQPSYAGQNILRPLPTPPCPDDGAASTRSDGGCWAVTGGMAMRTYVAPYSSSVDESGLRPFHTPDRCQATTSRPPFFPLTSRYTLLRSLSIDPNLANTPPKIRSLLLRLKGKAL